MRKLLLIAAVFAVICTKGEPFPAEKLEGVWKMSQTFVSESSMDVSGSDTTEIDNRIFVTFAFFGQDKCRMTASQSVGNSVSTVLMPFVYRYEYVNGTVSFVDVVNYAKSSTPIKNMVPVLNATRFELLKIDENTFELKYLDFGDFDIFYSFLGTSKSEYLGDGRMKTVQTNKAGKIGMSTVTIRPRMIFRRVGDLVSGSPTVEDSPIYKLISYEKDGDRDFAYRFKLKMLGDDGGRLRMFRNVQQELRVAVYEDFAKSYVAEANNFFVEFPELRMHGDEMEGVATVLSMNVTTTEYNPETRIGHMSIVMQANQFDVARKYVRKNIESLARNSNIIVTDARSSSAARFYITREEVKGGDVLELEFKTE